jgi:hypothetical protein
VETVAGAVETVAVEASKRMAPSVRRVQRN